MKMGTVKSNLYWGQNKGDIVYIDFSGKFQHDAIGIYDKDKKFIAYTWDRETLNECIGICS